MKHREIAEALAGFGADDVAAIVEAADALRSSNETLAKFDGKKKRRGPKPGSKRAPKDEATTPALPAPKAVKPKSAVKKPGRRVVDAFPA